MPFIILLLEADKNSPELVAPLLDPIADDPKALKKWMNDSDNRVFRTRQGVL